MTLALPLNLNIFEILIHLVNFAILIFFVKIFLYKPIKKFITNREDEYKKIDNDAEQKLLESTKLKEDYEKLLTESKQSAVQITTDALESAQIRGTEIIENAKNKAKELIVSAEKEISQKKIEEMDKLKHSISDLAYAMASEILKREINESDIDKQVDNLVDKWKDSNA